MAVEFGPPAFGPPSFEAEPVESTTDQPDSFPTRKVSTFGGVGLIVMQAFQVAADYGIVVVQSVRELVIMAISAAAAWWVKDRK